MLSGFVSRRYINCYKLLTNIIPCIKWFIDDNYVEYSRTLVYGHPRIIAACEQRTLFGMKFNDFRQKQSLYKGQYCKEMSK